MAFCKCVRSICILAFNGGKGQRQKDIERKRESNERKLERARGRERERERETEREREMHLFFKEFHIGYSASRFTRSSRYPDLANAFNELS